MMVLQFMVRLGLWLKLGLELEKGLRLGALNRVRLSDLETQCIKLSIA